MGQAKLRGTREERVAAALVVKAQRDAERALQREEERRLNRLEWNSLTPQQRSTRLLLAQAMVAVGVSTGATYLGDDQ